jgi:hypothetical protein
MGTTLMTCGKITAVTFGIVITDSAPAPENSIGLWIDNAMAAESLLC